MGILCCDSNKIEILLFPVWYQYIFSTLLHFNIENAYAIYYELFSLVKYTTFNCVECILF